LNSVWEHFSRFYFGAGKTKNQYVQLTDNLVRADSLLALITVPFVEVHDAEKAEVSRMVDTETKPFSTWYQVRNNMVHSGKDGTRDARILRDAVKGMATLLAAVVHSAIPDLKMGNS
jgi:hypothetical protein